MRHSILTVCLLDTQEHLLSCKFIHIKWSWTKRVFLSSKKKGYRYSWLQNKLWWVWRMEFQRKIWHCQKGCDIYLNISNSTIINKCYVCNQIHTFCFLPEIFDSSLSQSWGCGKTRYSTTNNKEPWEVFSIFLTIHFFSQKSE